MKNIKTNLPSYLNQKKKEKIESERTIRQIIFGKVAFAAKVLKDLLNILRSGKTNFDRVFFT